MAEHGRVRSYFDDSAAMMQRSKHVPFVIFISVFK